MDKYTIGIVVDRQDVAKALNTLYNNETYRTIPFSQSDQIIKAVSEEVLDLLILDVTVTFIDSTTLQNQLRRMFYRTLQQTQSPPKYVPIIRLEPQQERDFRHNQLADYYPDDYLTSPFDFEELRLRIIHALNQVKWFIEKEWENEVQRRKQSNG